MRGNGDSAADADQGLGPHLVGKQIDVNGRIVNVCKPLGEGGFSFVYLVRDRDGGDSSGGGDDVGGFSGRGPLHVHAHSPVSPGRDSKYRKRDNNSQRWGDPPPPQKLRQPPPGTNMVLKITAVHNNSQRHIAEKEARLLQQLNHPSIVQVYDHCYRDPSAPLGGGGNPGLDNALLSGSALHSGGDASTAGVSSISSASHASSNKQAAVQHLILLEYCEGGTGFDAVRRMAATRTRFDLPSLVIAFGQICNAVSYLHAQHPPVVHRDLKPVNFLVKNGAYKLCDFGSAVFGSTDLKTVEQRRNAEEQVRRTTTQMFRAPEMVDLYMGKKLTTSTDVWALGCCLYSLAYHRDCFEEGSNLAILSRKYKIPDDNPYGEGLVDLIDRMLTVDYRDRADMTEVILCLSALYSNRNLPLRKKKSKGGSRMEKESEDLEGARVGAFRTDGQGISAPEASAKSKKKTFEAKKLNPNSAAAKRKKASDDQKQKDTPQSSAGTTSPLGNQGDEKNGDFAAFEQAFEKKFNPFTADSKAGDQERNGRTQPDNSYFPGQRRQQQQNAGSKVGEERTERFQPDNSYFTGQRQQQEVDDFGFAGGNEFNFSAFNEDQNLRITTSTSFSRPGNVADGFEMTFQGFEDKIEASDEDNLFGGGGLAGNVLISDEDVGSKNQPSPAGEYYDGFNEARDDGGAIANVKKKKGLFGILGKR